MKYPIYYDIPWPENQTLMELDSVELDNLEADNTIIFSDVHNTFVEKSWFDKNRQKYGL